MPRENEPRFEGRPITPDEVTQLQRDIFPPEVFETFNQMIAEKLLDGEAHIRQDDVVEQLAIKGLERALIFRKGWLNVEEMYREAGWQVRYDKPAYNETGDAYFSFKAPKKS